MDTVLELIIEIAGAFLEVATDQTAKKHGKAKAILCLVAVLIILIAVGVLGIHWLSSGNVVAGILMLAIDVIVLGVFVLAAFRNKT